MEKGEYPELGGETEDPELGGEGENLELEGGYPELGKGERIQS